MTNKEEPISEDFTKALAECIHQAQGNVVDPMVLAETWKDELIKLAKSDEPVSEDLNIEMDNYLASVFSKDMDGGEPRFTTWFNALCKTARHFANWQKEQFEKNRLKHCDSITNEQAELEQKFLDQHLDKYNRMPTFLDAIEYGMRLQKEQIKTKED